METKKSYKQIFEFATIADNYKKRTDNKETKFALALTKMTGNTITQEKGTLSDIILAFYDKQADLRLEYCATDKDGIVLRDKTDPKNPAYLFTKEGEKALVSAFRELDKQEVEIKPNYVSKENIPADLTPTEIEYFTGFVIE